MPGAHDGRYAPSPTGDLHLGNLRTALVAWLFARGAGGRFLLRIDDLDPDRSRPEHAARQLDDLRALGLDWDDEPVLQSTRMARYDDALDSLVEGALVYPCFCTRADVRQAATAPHGDLPDGAYPGTCGMLDPADAAARVATGEPHCLRVRADRERSGFDDLLLGRVESVVDDFVVRRRDGVPAYNLATTLDEVDMGVGEVVRGADLAPSTVRQLWLHDLLGLGPAPRHAHVALVMGSDGTRLAKRHGAVTLRDLAGEGMRPEQVLGVLARTLDLPVGPDGSANLEDLLAAFDRQRIPAGDVVLEP